MQQKPTINLKLYQYTLGQHFTNWLKNRKYVKKNEYIKVRIAKP